MEWYNIESSSSCNVNFTQKIAGAQAIREERVLGGIIKCGAWSWIADNCTLRIVSLKSGQIISTFKFHRSIYNCAGIVCVEELSISKRSNNVLLAVCLDILPDNGNAETGNNSSVIAVYSVESGCVLNFMRLPFYVTCMRFLNSKNCRRSLLQNFDGCLSVGTHDGVILALDLYLNKLLDIHEEMQCDATSSRSNAAPCQIVDCSLPISEIHRIYKKCLRERNSQHIIHFGIQLEVVESPSAIESLLPINLIIGLAAGLNDGRLIIYDLSELQIFYASPLDHKQMPLVKMDFLEPPDDPRACLYILALHENGEKLLADLHTLMYEKRLADDHGICYFENFQHGLRKLHLPLENSTSTAISCQAITKVSRNVDDDATCLCILAWYSVLEEKNKLVVFDMNQWYKEEMPSTIHPNHAVSCLAAFYLNESRCGLQAFIHPSTIAHFNSMQRCEEHFYPNSLTFDCVLLGIDGCRNFHWPGIQNITLNELRASNSTIFLEPDHVFETIKKARLLPQFTELNINSLFTKNAKCEVILSVALEHNCIGLLRSCARSWADGSFTRNNSIIPNATELSSRTLINWIWKRATDIKMRCNELCKGLLHCAGYPLDQREKKELGFITRQLKNLAELLNEVLQQYKRNNIPEKTLSNLVSKHASLRLAAVYQELLLWLINIGLLPESTHRLLSDDVPTTSRLASRISSSIYPYKQLQDYYAQKRAAFAAIQENHVSKKSGSCRLMFIDAFIEHECMRLTSKGDANATDGDTLREYWLENDGNGLYPPPSIESMLRIMLLPNISEESKYSILLYFFLDLRVALTDLEQERGKDCTAIVENLSKFPSVFKLPQSTIKNIQSFWYLDHGNFLAAVDEFLSPFNKNQNCSQWLLELQLESLLTQNAAHFAIRVLDAHPNLIAPTLKLTILLANNLIAEAFHFARSKDDDELLKRFFISCLKMGQLGVIRDLALTEHEGQLVENLLKRSQMPGAENLHFVYLLQKSKYIEAVSYMDELAKEKCLRSTSNSKGSTIDAPNLVISAFNTTMAPVTQNLTDVYFRIRNKIKQKETQNRSPVPLSCQLIKQNANNLLGGIYHSSALSAHFATYYYDEELQFGRRDNQHGKQAVISPLSARNAPFLRKPQTETHSEVVDQLERQVISYPQEYKPSEKRRLSEIEQEESEISKEITNSEKLQLKQQPPNKRRRLVADDLLRELKHFNQRKIVLSDDGLLNESFMMKPVEGMINKQVVDQVDAVSVSSEQIAGKAVSSGELHSILKVNTPEPTEPRKLRRAESPAAEEKTIRFILPPMTIQQGNEDQTEMSHNAADKIENDIRMDEEEAPDTTQYYSMLSTNEKSNSSISIKAPSIKDSGISITKKQLGTSESSLPTFETTRGRSLSPKTSGPQPRKPLTRMSAEPETHPKSTYLRSVRSSKDISIQKKNSEFTESFKSSVENNEAISKLPSSNPSATFRIASVCTLNSNDFTPQVCSSKVGDMSSKLSNNDVKLSERSTMVVTSGFECDLDSVSDNKERFVQPRPSLASVKEEIIPKDKVTQPHLDTTLSMSSYDLTNLETTPTALITAESGIAVSIDTNEDKELTHVSSEQLPYLTASNEMEVSGSEKQLSELQDVSAVEAELKAPLSEDNDVDVNKPKILSDVIDLLSSSDNSSSDNDTEDEEKVEEVENVDSSDEEIDSEDDIEVEEEDEEEGEGDEDEEEEDYDDDEDNIESNEEEDEVSDRNMQYSSSSSVISGKNVEFPEIGAECEVEIESDSHSNDKDARGEELSDGNEHFTLKLDEDQSMEEQNLVNTDAENLPEKCETVEEVKGGISDEANLQKSADVKSVETEKQETVSDGLVYAEELHVSLVGELPMAKSSVEAVDKTETQTKDKQESLSDKILEKESVAEISKDVYAEHLVEELVSELPTPTTELNESNEPDIPGEKMDLLETDNLPLITSSQEKNSDILSNSPTRKPDSHLSEGSVEHIDTSEHFEKQIKKDLSPVASSTSFENQDQSKMQESTSVATTIQERHQNLDTSDNFETPNSSFRSVNDADETQSLKIPESSEGGTKGRISVVESKLSHNSFRSVEDDDEMSSLTVPNKKADQLTESPNSQASNASPSSIKKPQEESALLKLDSEKKNDEISVAESTNSPSDTEPLRVKDNEVIKKGESPKDNTPQEENIIVQKDKKQQLPIFINTSPANTVVRGGTKRGQSVPPQTLLNAEENLETDAQTPKRRSKRGISVPPQAIDSPRLNENVENLPIKKRNSAVRTELRRSLVIAEGDSPQSATSSRSGRESQSKRRTVDGSENTLLDSPALHTRSRVRTLSETSEATATSVNSPSTSLRRTRRTSISSNVSEQPQHSQTPKRSRRSSISAQSDSEGTPTSRRLLLKDAEEETAKADSPSVSAENYLHSRRLTRHQRALLDKLDYKPGTIETTDVKDDQVSVSSQISQTSSMRKRRSSQSASVNEDAEDDRLSVTSSAASELRRSSRRLRAQQQNSPSVSLSAIPEDESEEGSQTRSTRRKIVKK